MLYGQVETAEQRVDHLEKLRGLQDETGGFTGFVPFAFASILFSFALVPTTMTTIREPKQTNAPSMSLVRLFAISPIGAIAAIGSGMISGTFYSLGNVFGQGVGFSDSHTATFMAPRNSCA